MRFFIVLILISILSTVALVALNRINPNVLGKSENFSQIVYSLITLVLLSASLFRGNFRDFFYKIKHLGIWILLTVVLIGGYGFRHQLKQFSNVVILNLAPSQVTIKGEGMVEIAKSLNDHYMITAYVNNKSIYFLIDTGATRVSLTQQDAQNIGIDVDSLSYNQATNTANGINYSAAIIIPEITIGNITLRNIEGSVVRDGLDTSLLGMSFLSKLSEYGVVNDVMILKE